MAFKVYGVNEEMDESGIDTVCYHQCFLQAKEEAEKRMQTKKERNRKMEDKLLTNLKPLPQPQLVPTPEVSSFDHRHCRCPF